MPKPEINFEDIAKGKVRIDIVDKLENLRASLESNSLSGRLNKKEICECRGHNNNTGKA